MNVPAKRGPWLVSRAYDLGWFVAPGVGAALLGVLLAIRWPEPAAATGESRLDLAVWIGGVLLVDVAHVYASLYRTYLDPQARQLHREVLTYAPLAVMVLGVVAHLIAPLLFWSVLAYVAIFHFIKQHEGFVLLYLRRGDQAGRESDAQVRLARLSVWAGTALPVVYWHASLPRRFTWFMEGDLLVGLPTLVGTVAVWLQVPILAAFLVQRLALAWKGRGNPMVTALVLLPALLWNMGIVWFNDDRVFTVTNVLLHGIPYLALIWVTGGRDSVQRGLEGSGRRQLPVAVVAVVFYALLAFLALGEEALWDRLVWQDRPYLFGEGSLELADLGLAVAVSLLTVPQATHYVLDRHIWKVGERNPRLASQLGFGTPPPPKML